MDLAQFRSRSFMHRNYISLNEKEYMVTMPIKDPKKSHIIRNLRFRECSNELRSILEKTFLQIKISAANKHYKKEALDYIDYMIGILDIDESIKPLDLFIKELNYIFAQLSVVAPNIILESQFLRSDITYHKAQRFKSHADLLGADCYIVGINALEYCGKQELSTVCNSIYVQKFDYRSFQPYTPSKYCLSVLGLLPQLGWQNLLDKLFDKNIGKCDLKKHAAEFKYGIGKDFSNSLQIFDH